MYSVPRINVVKNNLKNQHFKACKNCMSRMVGCHSTCKLYINEKAAYEDACKNVVDQLRKEMDAVEVKIENSLKTIKRKGGR